MVEGAVTVNARGSEQIPSQLRYTIISSLNGTQSASIEVAVATILFVPNWRGIIAVNTDPLNVATIPFTKID